jgi:hypothetical protein
VTIAARAAGLGCAFVVTTFSAAGAQAPAAPPATSGAVTAEPSTGAGAPAYERKGRRDPFEPFDGVSADMTSPTVASARLKGIVRGRIPRALVETGDGLGYILKVGDALAEGRLLEIGVDNVVFSVTPRRGSTTDRIILRLAEDCCHRFAERSGRRPWCSCWPPRSGPRAPRRPASPPSSRT